jgi:hypothetical protein
VCDLLRALAKNETNAKSRLQDRTEYRGELEELLRDIGSKPTDARKEVANNLVNCQHEIKYQRTRIKTCAANMVKVVLDADQGKLEDLFEEVKPDLTRSLFEKMQEKPEPEDEPEDEPEAEPEKPAKEAKAKKGERAPPKVPGKKEPKDPPTKDLWRHAKIDVLKLPVGLIQDLAKTDLKNIGDLVSKIGIPANDRAAFSKVADEQYGIKDNSAIILGNLLQAFLDEVKAA